jgi:hypothetical protein
VSVAAQRATASAEARRAKAEGGSDTHHVLDDHDGFREALDPSCDPLPDGLFDLPDGQISDLPVTCLSSPLCKNILIFRRPKSLLYFPPSRSPEGRFAIVTNVARDVVDAGDAKDEGVCLRTAKSCGPDAPTLVSSRRDEAQTTVTKKPGHRGEHEISRKPLRGECRVFWRQGPSCRVPLDGRHKSVTS